MKTKQLDDLWFAITQPLKIFSKQKKIRSSSNKFINNSRSVWQDPRDSWIILFYSFRCMYDIRKTQHVEGCSFIGLAPNCCQSKKKIGHQFSALNLAKKMHSHLVLATTILCNIARILCGCLFTRLRLLLKQTAACKRLVTKNHNLFGGAQCNSRLQCRFCRSSSWLLFSFTVYFLSEQCEWILIHSHCSRE